MLPQYLGIAVLSITILAHVLVEHSCVTDIIMKPSLDLLRESQVTPLTFHFESVLHLMVGLIVPIIAELSATKLAQYGVDIHGGQVMLQRFQGTKFIITVLATVRLPNHIMVDLLILHEMELQLLNLNREGYRINLELYLVQVLHQHLTLFQVRLMKLHLIGIFNLILLLHSIPMMFENLTIIFVLSVQF